jgi:tetratricopeptide (TPR) repeat protein
VILALAIAGCRASARDFQQQWEKLARDGTEGQIDRLVEDWKAAEPNNPEVYVSAANYYFRKAQQGGIQISRKSPEEGDFLVSDPESGDVVGSLGVASAIDSAVASRAAGMLREATVKFPERLDIWFGLAHIHQELDNFDAQYAAVEGALEYATAHPTALKWQGGEPLSEDPAQFIPDAVQAYLSHYFRRGTAEDDERFLRLAKLVAGCYPQHPYPVNSLAAYHAAREEWANALPFLEKAHALDPDDPLIMMNLGMVHSRLDDNAKARAYYERVLASDADDEILEQAREKLAELMRDEGSGDQNP